MSYYLSAQQQERKLLVSFSSRQEVNASLSFTLFPVFLNLLQCLLRSTTMNTEKWELKHVIISVQSGAIKHYVSSQVDTGTMQQRNSE